MTDQKTDVDYFVLLEGISSCCEEGFRQGVHFVQTKVIPHKVATAERQAKIEVLEEVEKDIFRVITRSSLAGQGISTRIKDRINELKAGN